MLRKSPIRLSDALKPCYALLACTLLTAMGVAPASASPLVPVRPGGTGGCPVLAGPASLPGVPAEGSVQAPGDTGVHIPEDEAPHNVPVEWWYFNGHLEGMDPAGHMHCYGFEYVIFQYVGIAPQPVYFGNFAVSDLDRGTFQYGVREDSYSLPTTVDSFALHTDEWTMSGGSGHDTLHADLPDYTLDLVLQSTKRPVLEGPGGIVNTARSGRLITTHGRRSRHEAPWWTTASR